MRDSMVADSRKIFLQPKKWGLPVVASLLIAVKYLMVSIGLDFVPLE